MSIELAFIVTQFSIILTFHFLLLLLLFLYIFQDAYRKYLECVLRVTTSLLKSLHSNGKDIYQSSHIFYSPGDSIYFIIDVFSVFESFHKVSPAFLRMSITNILYMISCSFRWLCLNIFCIYTVTKWRWLGNLRFKQ